MEVINIIIDNVDDIYIFNLIESKFPGKYLHFKTKVNSTLIHEFLTEITNINQFVLSIENLDFNTSYNIINKFKIISETFFRQFFPEQIIEKFQLSEGGYLFLHIDSVLSFIPWDLLYDGNSFLGDKFRIGININSVWKEKNKIDKSKLKILIIVNPGEDLLEAAEEGELLFEALNTEISSDLLQIQMYSGDRINKFKFLSEIQNYDILHFAGHVIYDENNNKGGILLANNEILYEHEIEKLPNSPYFIFLNACKSAMNITNIGLANSFLKAGVSNYIGTNWIIPDSKNIVEFAINFYHHLFDEKTIGDALFEARKFARENHPFHQLIWASYSLFGNPTTKLFRYPERRTFDGFRTDWNLKKVFNEFPTFIADSYYKFTQEKKQIHYLIQTFKTLIITVMAIIIETYNKLNLKLNDMFDEEIFLKYDLEKEILKNEKKQIKREEWLDYSYICGKRLNLLNIQLIVSPIIKSYLLHKEDIIKMFQLVDLYVLKNNTTENLEDIETFIVSFQYLLENLFIDFSLISRIQFFYNNGLHYPSLLFKGLQEKSYHVLPIFKEDVLLKNFLSEHIGEICLIIQDFYISLKNYIEYEPLSKQFRFKIKLI